MLKNKIRDFEEACTLICGGFLLLLSIIFTTQYIITKRAAAYIVLDEYGEHVIELPMMLITSVVTIAASAKRLFGDKWKYFFIFSILLTSSLSSLVLL